MKQEELELENNSAGPMNLSGGPARPGSTEEGRAKTEASESAAGDDYADLLMDDEEGIVFEDDRIADGVFHCRLCDKTFSSRGLLNVHYTHTHRDKPQYECEDCGLVFTVKRELATHRRVHSGSPLHTCMQCGKVFGTKQLLKKHHLWHTGQRSHICPQCGKAFYQKGHLTQHLMIHTGGRPHVCHLCRKTFVFKFDLNRHLKIHAERGHMAGDNVSDMADGEESMKFKKEDIHSFNLLYGEHGDRQSNASPYSGVGSPSNSITPPQQDEHQANQSGEEAESAGVSSLAAAEAVSANQMAAVAAANGIFFASPGQPMSIADWFAFQAAYQASVSHHLLQAGAAGIGGKGGAGGDLPGPLGVHGMDHENEAIESSDTASPNNEKAASESDEGIADVKPSTFSFSSSSNESGEDPASCQSARDCVQCTAYLTELKSANRRIVDLEKQLEQRDADTDRVKQRSKRMGKVAGGLLETCSDFDKLWMLHSKKVYNSVQTILSNLDT